MKLMHVLAQIIAPVYLRTNLHPVIAMSFHVDVGCKLLMITRRCFYGGNFTRAVVELETKVENALEAKEYKPKYHPGRTARNLVALPERFLKSAEILLRSYPGHVLRKQAVAFGHYLASRKPPPERSEIHMHASIIEAQLRQEVDPLEKDEERVEKMIHSKIKSRLAQKIYNWKPIEYDTLHGMLYLIARASPDFAVLTSIFMEIKSRVPNFRPTAIFDFGSGVGTVLWSAHSTWGESIEEYFAVDSASNMNDISRLLLQDGKEENQPFVKGTFFRQFLPALHMLQYDLVVSSYSLMELTSRDIRIQTLENLWAKTKQFLVIVENGSNAGYNLILEARDFILKNLTSDVHVFAPCSHDGTCPKQSSGFPCNFQVGYLPFLSKSEDKKIERFSYVVLQKTKRSEGDTWPRIIGPVLPRHHHVVIRMCCSDGLLKEAVLTKSKSSKFLYKCARASHWGDLLPVSSEAVLRNSTAFCQNSSPSCSSDPEDSSWT